MLNFKNSINTHKINSLHKKITTILTAFKPQNQIILHLKNPNNIIHNYKLTTSQLQHLHNKNIPLTITINKITANNNYIITYITNKIISTPFTIINSINIITQIPNFNHFLKNKNINIKLHTTKQYKHTLTLLNKNTKKKQKKFHKKLNKTHQLFKNFIKHIHPSLNIKQITTNKH